jgi:hypothetical protein
VPWSAWDGLCGFTLGAGRAGSEEATGTIHPHRHSLPSFSFAPVTASLLFNQIHTPLNPGRNVLTFHDPVASPQDPSTIPDWPDGGVMVSFAATCGFRALLFAFLSAYFSPPPKKRGVWLGLITLWFRFVARSLIALSRSSPAGRYLPPRCLVTSDSLVAVLIIPTLNPYLGVRKVR